MSRERWDYMLKFENWSTERRARALQIMDEYVRKHAPGYGTEYWRNEGYSLKSSPEETQKNWQIIAEDEEKFTNALFSFYVAMTTDLSWFFDQL